MTGQVAKLVLIRGILYSCSRERFFIQKLTVTPEVRGFRYVKAWHTKAKITFLSYLRFTVTLGLIISGLVVFVSGTVNKRPIQASCFQLDGCQQVSSVTLLNPSTVSIPTPNLLAPLENHEHPGAPLGIDYGEAPLSFFQPDMFIPLGGLANKGISIGEGIATSFLRTTLEEEVELIGANSLCDWSASEVNIVQQRARAAVLDNYAKNTIKGQQFRRGLEPTDTRYLSRNKSSNAIAAGMSEQGEIVVGHSQGGKSVDLNSISPNVLNRYRAFEQSYPASTNPNGSFPGFLNRSPLNCAEANCVNGMVGEPNILRAYLGPKSNSNVGNVIDRCQNCHVLWQDIPEGPRP